MRACRKCRRRVKNPLKTGLCQQCRFYADDPTPEEIEKRALEIRDERLDRQPYCDEMDSRHPRVCRLRV